VRIALSTNRVILKLSVNLKLCLGELAIAFSDPLALVKNVLFF